MPRPARLRSLNDFLGWGTRAFIRARLYFGHGTDSAAADSFQLAVSVLGWSAAQARRRLNRTLTPAEAGRLQAAFGQRIRTRMPSAYLTQEAEFAGLRFHVDRRVLIPRSPIAELINNHFQPWLLKQPGTILDLCAGSGCIGIACAKAFPNARVDLAELDEGALAVCRSNVSRHRLGRRVRALHSDLFAALEGHRYDLIVTNPPYVPLQEWKRLPPEYRHEPRLALEAGRDGMDLVSRILEDAADHLVAGGNLICEVGGSVRQFEKRFPRFPALWLEFEHGGDGVFIISREELVSWQRKRK